MQSFWRGIHVVGVRAITCEDVRSHEEHTVMTIKSETSVKCTDMKKSLTTLKKLEVADKIKRKEYRTYQQISKQLSVLLRLNKL